MGWSTPDGGCGKLYDIRGRPACVERAPPPLRAVLVIGLLLSTGAATGILGLTPVRALPSATLETPYTATGVDADSPPDGQYDYLVVELTVNVSSAGGFLLWVDLSGRGLASRWLNLDLGRHRVQLPIDGHVLRGMGVDGPYGLDLTLETDTSALLDRASFTTAAFRFTDFEGPDTVMTGPTSDRGLDMDVPPNGLLDFMEVTTSVRVTEAGWYRLSATTLGVGSFVDRWLDPGPAANLSVRFPGFELSQSRYSGRFTVDLFFGTNHSSYVTRSYNWTDFEPVPAAVGTGASDAGIDTDTPPDGLYDELSVRIPVSVNRSGDYRIGATAYSGNQYVDRAEAYRFIANGSGEIELRIPRTRIVANRMDGP